MTDEGGVGGEPAGGGFGDVAGATGGEAEAEGGGIAADAEDMKVSVEEEDVDGEAHEEGVDAAAVGEEKQGVGREGAAAEEAFEALEEGGGDNNIHNKKFRSSGVAGVQYGKGVPLAVRFY